MGDLLTAIKNIWGKYKTQIILGLALIASIIFLVVSVSKGITAKKIYDNNVKALTEEVQTWKTKSGDLVAEKTVLEGDVKLLKQTNEELYEQVKKLKARPEQVVYVETQVINEVHDTTYVVPEINDYLKQSFDFSNKWRTLTGYIEYNKPNLGLTFEKDIVNVDYTIAIKDSKVYVTSNNPYVQYNDIQGVVLPSYKPMWSLTVGPAFGAGYGLITKKPDMWVGFNITLGYSLVSFGKKK